MTFMESIRKVSSQGNKSENKERQALARESGTQAVAYMEWIEPDRVRRIKLELSINW